MCQNSYRYNQKKKRKCFTCLYSYIYYHRSEDITERVKTYKFAVEKTMISPHVPIFKYNSIEPLDVPMFHIRIVQVKRRSITLHAYTPKDSTEPLDVPMFHIRNVQVKRRNITTHAYIPKTITIAPNHELLQEEPISEQYNNPYHIVQSYK